MILLVYPKIMTHPVNETLQEPFGAVNACRHLLFVLEIENTSQN